MIKRSAVKLVILGLLVLAGVRSVEIEFLPFGEASTSDFASLLSDGDFDTSSGFGVSTEESTDAAEAEMPVKMRIQLQLAQDVRRGIVEGFRILYEAIDEKNYVELRMKRETVLELIEGVKAGLILIRRILVTARDEAVAEIEDVISWIGLRIDELEEVFSKKEDFSFPAAFEACKRKMREYFEGEEVEEAS